MNSDSKVSDNIIEVFAELLAEKVAARIEGRKSVISYRDDDTLNTPDAAKYLGKSPGTLRNWRALKKHLPFYINKDTLDVTYKFSDLKAYKERKNRVSPNG
jgi:hypothetical protein